ncbi:hypothetical protein [Rhizobium leguminosarum]|nr:hypothetical protein [Rhizobium leguminosarum]
MSDKPRGVIYIGVTSDLHGRIWEHRNEIQKGRNTEQRISSGLSTIRTSCWRSSGKNL